MQNNDELRDRLGLLHDELEKAIHRSPLDRDMLGHVMQDIVLISQGEEQQANAEPETLKSLLERQASDFEAEHPRLSGLLREAADILARMGI